MPVPKDVNVVRLYYKSAGSQTLRKSAAAELAHLIAAGWQETNRKAAADHVVVRFERPRPAQPWQAPAGSAPGRPRR